MPDRELPRHVTMPLLDRIVSSALDEEYADAAESRQQPTSGARRTGVAAASLAVIGLLGATAFVANNRDQQVDDSSRAVLISQIESEQEALGADQDRLNELQAEVVRTQNDVAELGARLSALDSRTQRLGLVSGYVPAQGPGVRVTVDDSPSGLPDEAVRDEDLALLVDGLWGAGAEAIAINGKRLTVLSPIRNSSVAINVNSRPLSPPYVVEAIGNTDTLQSRLLASVRGNEFFGLADQLGFAYDLENVDRLTLPAARVRTLRHAVAQLDQTDDSGAAGGTS